MKRLTLHLALWMGITVFPCADALAIPHVKRWTEAISQLTANPHRLPGSGESARAAEFIKKRLQESGVAEVHSLVYETWYPELIRAELRWGDTVVPLAPLRPNLTVWPTTPEEGLTGPLLYAGAGNLADYGGHDPSGHVVLLDYDSGDNWRRAFALGAKAVVFIEQGETPAQPRYANVPVNFVRMQMAREDLPAPPESLSGKEATLISHVNWMSRPSEVVYARIPGHTPDAQGPLVLSAAYDTFGVVPHRSPGARRAANVALLLEYADHFIQQPPRRDVVLLFTSSRAYHHGGARRFYDALTLSSAQLTRLLQHRSDETSDLQSALDLLDTQGLTAPATGSDGSLLHRLLTQEAQFMRDDLAAGSQSIRLDYARREAMPDSIRRILDERETKQQLVDEIRRALHERQLPAFVEAAKDDPDQRPLRDQLEQATRHRLASRLAELHTDYQFWDSALNLRRTFAPGGAAPDGVDPGRILLHVEIDFGDRTPRWGVALGDSTMRLLGHISHVGSDMPGNYIRLLSELQRISEDNPHIQHWVARTATDPLFGETFIGAPFTSGGRIAGLYGFYNIMLTTQSDARLRDGHPADTMDRLDKANLLAQGNEALRLVEDLVNMEVLRVGRTFAPAVESKFSEWRNRRSWGDFASLSVVGGLAENRPAEDAVLAFWIARSRTAETHWNTLQSAAILRDFMPYALTRVNRLGRFEMIGHLTRATSWAPLAVNAILTDEFGNVTAINNQATQNPGWFPASHRVALFPATGAAIKSMPGNPAFPANLNVLKGTTNFGFRRERAMWGISDHIIFAYLSERERAGGLKLFQFLGPVLMGERGIDPESSRGLNMLDFATPPRASDFGPWNLWDLNESRFASLRARGVSRADLERLHNRALATREQAEASATLVETEALRMASLALSHRLYAPLRTALDDLIVAIVLLLLLSIPFAFAMERLLIGATSIYGRISGFSVMFSITFALLYFMHPGFAISTAPMIIFLAFIILGLSGVVIYMLLRRFKQELQMMQGQGDQAHEVEVSRAGTMLAAIGMGMSTMRRRPTRTLLTSITVVALTFTILCFASFSRDLGVRFNYLGSVPDRQPEGILVRTLNYAELPFGLKEMLARFDDDSTVVASHWWLNRQNAEAPSVYIVNPASGEGLELEAVLGIDPREAARWPALADIADQPGEKVLARALKHDEVLLPPFVMHLLDLAPGDPVRIAGQSFTAGPPLSLDALQNLRGIDGESPLPVDTGIVDPDALGMAAEPQEATLDLDMDVERDLIRLSAGQVAVTSAVNVQRLGGDQRAVTIYPSDTLDTRALAENIAHLVAMPVWVASGIGMERLVLTTLTHVTGAMAVAVPLFLGGLIIFGTLLGSITDREREIYTFSALGLGPSHVGMLFFAEAGVYAVVGGMGGQLLAQITALVASGLARHGLIEPITINFSSTNSLFAIGIVMGVVLVSSLYPAYRASKSANPGLARTWRMPSPKNGCLDLTFPFTVSAYDITGVVSFIAEHLRSHDDAGLGRFATTLAELRRGEEGNLELRAQLALAPFDLGVTEEIILSAQPSEIKGVDEVRLHIECLSGAESDWVRGTRVFLEELRAQFLAWRTLKDERIEAYRRRTLEELGEQPPRNEQQ